MPHTPPRNYYQLLELENFSDVDQVKAAFRRLARQYHPDLNAGNKAHEERFKLINEAYDVIGTSEKKAIYDDALRVILKIPSANKKPSAQSQGHAAPKAKTPPKDAGLNAKKETADAPASKAAATPPPPPVNEFFENVRKAFSQNEQSSFFGGGVNQAKTKAGKPKRGPDVNVEAVITFQEAKDGVVKTVNVQHQDICKRCSGTGKVTGKSCSMCHGEKILTKLKKIDVKIPAGVKSGSKVRVAGEGVRGESGGDPGDLFLQIQVGPAPEATEQIRPKGDEAFRIEGLDVHGEVAISITDAVLGATVDVLTMHGQLKLTIPPLTSSGRVLRLKEQGVHSGGMKGDHYVSIRIVAPENLSSRERELYQELAQLHYQRKAK